MFQLRIRSTCLSAVLLAAVASIASGQATRTWVSGVGDDANPCSRTAPCKTFAGAISKTAAGGEIDVLDPGGFGAVTITKSIRIDGTPVVAGVLVSGTNGIIINAQPTDTVVLKGLTIDGLNVAGAFRGIEFVGGGTLEVEDCEIFGFGQRGISIDPTNLTANVSIANTVVTKGLSNGIVVVPAPSGTVQVSLENVHVRKNVNFGVSITAGTTLNVHNSEITGNGLDALRVDGTNGAATAHLDDTVIVGNTTGIEAITGSTVRVSNSTITGNGTGLLFSGGTIQSFGNNRVAGNGAGNSGMSSVSLQ